MSNLNSSVRNAKREFLEFVEFAWDFITGLSTAEQLLASCMVCLVLMWALVRRSDDGDDTKGLARQFGFAVAVIVMFGGVVGYVLGPNLSSVIDSLF